MDFAEHGTFKIRVENNCLIIDATGPFNEELTKHYDQSINDSIDKIDSDNWDQIIVLHQLSLFTPEAETLLNETLINRKNRGLGKSAVVLIDIEGKHLIIQQLSRIYQALDIEYEFFDSLSQAKAWLKG